MINPKFIYMKIISNIRRVIYNLLRNIVFKLRGIINKLNVLFINPTREWMN